MTKQVNVNLYVPDETEFKALIYAAAIALKEKGYKLSQYEGQAPSKSAVVIAALKEIVKEYKNRDTIENT